MKNTKNMGQLEKFKGFLNIFDGVMRKQKNVENSAMSKELTEKYKSYFNGELYDLCAEMQVNGFCLSAFEKEHLKEAIKEAITKDFRSYSKYKDIYGDFDEDFKIDLFLKSESMRVWKHYFDEEYKDSKFNSKIIHMKAKQCLRDYVDTLKKVKETGLIKKESYGSDDKIKKYNKISEASGLAIGSVIKQMDLLAKVVIFDMKNVEFDDILYLKKIFVEIKTACLNFKNNKRMNLGGSYIDESLGLDRINSHINEVDGELNNHKEKEKNKIITQINLFNNENGITREIVFKYSTTDVPKEAKDILKTIHENYYKARNTEDTVVRLELDNKLKDANDAVSKYMSIDKEYRDTLVNVSGKSPYDLMLESLDTIKKDFDVLLMKNNQSLVNDLSVINRKVQTKKYIT